MKRTTFWEMIRARMSPGRWQLLNIPWILLVWLSAHASDQRPTVSDLPLALQSSISAALGGDIASYRVQMRAAGFHAENAQHHLAVDFGPEGVEVRTGETHWRMTLRGYGHRSAMRAVEAVAPQASLNRVEYRHGALTEWYVNGPMGLEQGFTITARLTCSPLSEQVRV